MVWEFGLDEIYGSRSLLDSGFLSVIFLMWKNFSMYLHPQTNLSLSLMYIEVKKDYFILLHSLREGAYSPSSLVS